MNTCPIQTKVNHYQAFAMHEHVNIFFSGASIKKKSLYPFFRSCSFSAGVSECVLKLDGTPPPPP